MSSKRAAGSHSVQGFHYLHSCSAALLIWRKKKRQASLLQYVHCQMWNRCFFSSVDLLLETWEAIFEMWAEIHRCENRFITTLTPSSWKHCLSLLKALWQCVLTALKVWKEYTVRNRVVSGLIHSNSTVRMNLRIQDRVGGETSAGLHIQNKGNTTCQWDKMNGRKFICDSNLTASAKGRIKRSLSLSLHSYTYIL